MLNDLSFDIFIGNESFFECISTPPNDICVSTAPFYLSKDKFLLLSETLNSTPSPIWLNLYSDAINFSNIYRFKEAILFFNISLENFINLEILPRIKNILDKNQYNSFITSTEYNDSPFKEFVSKDVFDKMIKKELFSNHPSVSKILKKSIDLSLNDKEITKSQIGNIINNIRKYRNDITHGRTISSDLLEVQVPSALNSFKILLKAFGYSL